MGNFVSHDFSVFTDYKLFEYTKRTLYNTSHILDQWALELQHFNVKFEHIQGKKNVVTDAISRLRAFKLYQDNDNEEVQLSLKDVLQNLIKEIHSIQSTSKLPTYTKMDKLNLNLLRREQLHGKFCKKKAKEIKTK